MMDEQKIGPEDEKNSVKEQLAYHYRCILSLLGEDVEREGLKKTPERVAKAMMFLTKGYKQSAKEILSSARFKYEGTQMVVVKDIEFYSMCEHHMLPFFGKVHIGYIAADQIVGLSKIPRLVDAFARRLQVQERFTTEMMNALSCELSTHGVIVLVEARHLCMQMRGVEKQDSSTVTCDFCGDFKNESLRQEFYRRIGRY